MAEKPAAAADKADNVKKKASGAEALVKHHFWILGAGALIAAAVVWWMGTGALAEQYEKDKRTNDQAFTIAKMLKSSGGKNTPPNESYKKTTDAIGNTLAENVKGGWESLYKRQTDLFTVNDKVKVLKDLILLEPDERKALLQPKEGETSSRLASNVAATIQTYHNNQVLEEDFAALFEPLNIRRVKGTNAFGRPVGGQPVGEGVDGILLWKAPYSPQQLMARYDTSEAPSIDRIAVTYEDIWTFRSLFGIIAEINKRPINSWLAVMNGETPPELPVDQGNVPIKRVDFCDIAQYAISASNMEGDKVQLAAAPSDPLAGTEGLALGDDAGAGGSAFTVGTTGSAEEDAQLLKDRYLDGRNTPVPDPSNPPFTEFKQMFVQIRVLMDQRLVPVLIAQCANAPLPLETRQIKLALDQVDVVRKVDASANAVEKIEQSPHDAIVTLRGVLYIYTIPAVDKLGRGSDAEPIKRDFGIPKQGVSGATELQAF